MSSQDANIEDRIPAELRRSLRKKYNVKATRVESVQNGITHRPVLLKEGYLHKPAFFRFGGKRKRYCVLRTYSSTEASLDIFVDDSKCRYKGSICLDKAANPTMLVRSTEVDGGSSASKRGKLLTTYIVLKVGKNTYHFATESYSDLKEWCAFFRQVIYPGNLFSAKIVEPHNLDDGTVNVQFSSTYIALICPVKELSIKRWRMEHITSFGQCGGMLTFECCSRCSSDPNITRCSLNIKQEKPSTILSAMEKMVRDNPNTQEIHYERSILGDIYHCSHQCGSKLFGAISDTDLHKLTGPKNIRNKLEASLPPPDLSTAQEFDFSNTLDSNDSGFPGTPHFDESPRSSSQLSSPTYSGGKPSPIKKQPSPPGFVRTRSCSEDPRYTQMPPRESAPVENHSRITSYQERENSLTASLPISYSPIKTSSKDNYNKLEPVTEVNRYASNGPPTPPERRESRYPPKSNSPPLMIGHGGYSSPSRARVVPITLGKTPPPPKVLSTRQKSSEGHPSGSQVRDSSADRDQPVAELAPPLPTRPQMFRRNTELTTRQLPDSLPRQRSQSQSDVLEERYQTPTKHPYKSTTSEEDDSECGDYDSLQELKSFNPMFRLDSLQYDETDGDQIDEVMSNLADYRRQKGITHGAYVKPAVIDKVLSKVACDTVKGYAYKISIPVAGNVVYDVPRRLAVEADPKHDNPYAPPKPVRNKMSKSTELIDHCVSPSKSFPTTPVVSTEA